MSRCLHVVDPTSDLYTLDPATGSARLLGATGVLGLTDIGFHGPTLYGVSFGAFARLDPDTGAATVIGSIGFTTNGLAVASDGSIYAGTTAGELLTIDPTTGAGTAVGLFGGGLVSSGDLALDSNDVLFGSLSSGGPDVLAQIDRATGTATVIGPVGVQGLYGLAFYCCRLYGATSEGELVDINVATGRAEVIGRNRLTQWGMAAKPCCGC